MTFWDFIWTLIRAGFIIVIGIPFVFFCICLIYALFG